jgi:hypothetical protein
LKRCKIVLKLYTINNRTFVLCIAFNNFKCFEYYKAKNLNSDTKSGMTSAEEYKNHVTGNTATGIWDIYLNTYILNTISYIITVWSLL